MTLDNQTAVELLGAATILVGAVVHAVHALASAARSIAAAIVQVAPNSAAGRAALAVEAAADKADTEAAAVGKIVGAS